MRSGSMNKWTAYKHIFVSKLTREKKSHFQYTRSPLGVGDLIKYCGINLHINEENAILNPLPPHCFKITFANAVHVFCDNMLT